MDLTQFLKDLSSLFNDMLVPRLAPMGANFEEMEITGALVVGNHVFAEWQDGVFTCHDWFDIGNWWFQSIWGV
jgi:hypothetical protein